jgi:AraC-like DNA-binding protein
LLLWARLMHAGRWLGEPGRSAESVSRQLDYANGATFRRALRNYLELTPTEIRSEGGLDVVLRAFLDVCGLPDSLRDARSVA